MNQNLTILDLFFHNFKLKQLIMSCFEMIDFFIDVTKFKSVLVSFGRSFAYFENVK